MSSIAIECLQKIDKKHVYTCRKLIILFVLYIARDILAGSHFIVPRAAPKSNQNVLNDINIVSLSNQLFMHNFIFI